MPTYVYKCLECEDQFDVQQSFSDPTLAETTCPSCHTTRPVRKVFTPVGVTFKGSGFYKTDSRGSSKTTTSAKNGEAPASTGTSSDSSSSSTGGSSSSTSSDNSSSGTKGGSAPSAGSTSSSGAGSA